MIPKKIIDLRKDALAILHYRKGSLSAPVRQERLPFASKEEEQKSPGGFQLELHWPEDICLGFLRYWGHKDTEDSLFFLEHLELLLSCTSHCTLVLHRNISGPNLFRILDNRPYFIYLEQSTFSERSSKEYGEAKEFSAKTMEDYREQIEKQILLLPAGTGPQKINLDLEYQSNSKMESKIKTLRFIWDFKKQHFQAQAILSLTPLKISAQTKVTKLKKGQKPGPIKDPAFFWESELEKLSKELNIETKLKHKLNHAASRAFLFPLSPSQPSSSGLETNTKLEGLSIKKLKSTLTSLASQKGRYGLCCLDLGTRLNLNNAMELYTKFALDKVSKEIRASRLQAGLSFTPLLVARESSMLIENQELLLKREGQKVSFPKAEKAGEIFDVLDLSHPEYSKWLSKTVHRIVNKWKFSYLHLTGLEAAYLRGDGHASGKSGTEYLQMLLEIISQAAGKKTILSAAQDFLWPGLHILKYVNPDTQNMQTNKKSKFWPGSRISDKKLAAGIQLCLQTLAERACLQHRPALMGVGDILDILYKRKLSKKQKCLLFSIVGLFGGQFFISLPFVELDICSEPDFIKMLELHRKCVSQRPLALGMGYPLTNRGYGKTASKTHRTCPVAMYHPAGFLGLWNPTRRLELIEFSPAPNSPFSETTRMRDYWTGQYIPWHWQADKIQIALAPFESFVAEIF